MPTSLRVHRHTVRARCVGRSGAPSPEAVTSGLADALRAAAPVNRDGVWLVRHLDVHAAVPADAAARSVAGSLAAALMGELDRTLAAGPSEADVKWFPDRAAFLEQWLVDLGSGRAQSQWEYRAFAADSAAAAIRARAETEPDEFLTTLRRLSATHLDEIIASLAPGDAAAVVHSLARGSGSLRVSELAVTAAQLAITGRLPRDPGRATLLLLISHGTLFGPGDAASARDVLLVLLDVQACAWQQRGVLLDALRDADWAAAARLGATAAAVALAGRPAAVRAATIEAVRHADSTPEAAAERGYTRFGGQFLLLPLLAELPLAEATADWPSLDGAAAQVVSGALAVTGVLGTDLVLADPFLRLATGLPECTRADLAGWTDEVGPGRFADLATIFHDARPERADVMQQDLDDPDLLVPGLPRYAALAVRAASSALLRELAYRLPGMAVASAGHLRRNVLATDALVTVDHDRIVVELGHPPLNLLLSLTGMNRRSYVLPATGHRPWMITTQR